MSLHRRGIDQHVRRRPARRGQGVEHLGQNAFGRPPHEATIERLARAVDGRGIDPASAGLQHMDDAADDAAIVDPRIAARIRRQVRHEPRKLFLAQPKPIVHRTTPAVWERETHRAAAAQAIYGSGA